MTDLAEIERITQGVVDANTAPGTTVSVSSKPAIDWTGDPILEVSIVIKPEGEALLIGQTPLNILTQLSDRLMDVGEDRFPIIDYATTAELEAVDVDSES